MSNKYTLHFFSFTSLYQRIYFPNILELLEKILSFLNFSFGMDIENIKFQKVWSPENYEGMVIRFIIFHPLDSKRLVVIFKDASS